VLMDFGAYSEWNPYALKLRGGAVVGDTIALTIILENWAGPVTVHPTIVRIEEGRCPRLRVSRRSTVT
jgi:hypothetical protein